MVIQAQMLSYLHYQQQLQVLPMSVIQTLNILLTILLQQAQFSGKHTD
jgi:hypothetical protein